MNWPASMAEHNGGAAAPVPALPVHITNGEQLAGMGHRDGPRRHIRSVYRTFVLTHGMVIPVLAEDLSRFDVWFQAYGGSVVLCESQSQAQDPANQAGAAGVFAGAPANPQGTLLYVPAGASFTTPVPPVSGWLRLQTSDPVWATTLADSVTMLAMVTHNRAEGY